MIRVQLNDTTFVDVEGTTDGREAASAARRWFQQNRPEEFEVWRRSQLGLGSSLARGASAGIDQFQSSLFSAAEGLGRAVGSPSLENFGREGRIKQDLQAEAAFPSELRQPFTEVEGVGGAARATAEAVTGSLPSTATGLGGALLGAKLGSVLGPAGAIGGGIIGGTLAAAPVLFGQNIRRQQEVSGDIVSPGAAARAAAIQAPLESAADIATLGAARVFRRPVTEAAQAATPGLGRRIATGAGVGAAIEAPVEVAQTALERQQAGLPVFTTEGGAGREYLEAGLGGAAAGGVTGGALRGAFGGQRTPPQTAEQEAAALQMLRESTLPGESLPAGTAAPAPPPVTEGAPSRPEPLTIPERPEPFTDVEEARAFLAANRAVAPTVMPTQAEGILGAANNARIEAWNETVANTRATAIKDFFPADPQTTAISPVEAINNIAAAANRGDLGLRSFTPNEVARAALISRDLDPGRVTKNEIQEVTKQLNALADTGAIRQNTVEATTKKGKKVIKREPSYSINYGTAAQPTPAPAPAPQAAAAPAPVPPATQGAPVPQAAPAPPAPQAPSSWMAANAQAALDLAQRAPAITQRIRDLHNQGKVAKEIADELGLDVNDVRVIRDSLGLQPLGPSTFGLAGPALPSGTPAAATPAPASPVRTVPGPAPTPAAPAQPTARTTVEVGGVRRETTPETLQQTVDEMRTGPRPATASPPSPPSDIPPGLAKAPMPDDLKKQIDSQTKEPIIGSVLNFFSSPTLTLTKLSRNFFPVRQTVEKFIGLENIYKDFSAQSHKSMTNLSDTSKQKVLPALANARRTRQEVNPADFTTEEMAAIRDFRRAMDFNYDAAIEGLTRKYFDPAFATDAAQRARLETFKNRYAGQFVAKIPNGALEAASPEGAKLVRQYNARRDPLYFPERADGTHFVAAYKLKPGGKREADATALIPYTPLNLLQRSRGFQDPEAEAIRRLREEFPNSNEYYVMPAGQRFENDARARDVKANADFISKYLERLRDASGLRGKQIIESMSKEIDKATMDSLFKPYKGILRAVTPENAVEYASNYLPAYYLTAARLNARLYTKPDFDAAFKPLRPENRERFESILAYATAPSEAYGAAQTFVFFQYLGFALDTAAVSAMQIPVSVAPRFARDAGAKGEAYLTKALNNGLFNKALLNVLKREQAYSKTIVESKNIPRDEAEAIRRAIQRGVFVPSASFQMQGSVSANDIRAAGIVDKDAAKFANGINKVVDLSGRPLAAIEEYGRLATFQAAYQMARDNPAIIEASNRYDNTNYKNAEDYAAGVVFDTWYTASKFDDPGFVRNFPITKVTFQFMRPVFKLTETMIRDATQTLRGIAQTDLTMARMGAISFFGSVAALVLLGGLWALPFADLSRELLERLLKSVFDNPIDFRLELDRAMGGGRLGEFANFGLPQASNVAALSKRIAVDPIPSDTLFNWSTLSLIGPAGDLIARIPRTFDHWKRGEYWEAAASFPLTPRVVGNATKGAQLAIDEEQFTQAGTRFITPQLLERVDQRSYVPASARQAFGFPAPELANERELWRRAQVIDKATDDVNKSITMELSRIILRALEAQRRGDMAEHARQIERLRLREREITAEQAEKPPHLRGNVNREAAFNRARQDLLGRSSPEILLEETRRQARPALPPIIEEMRWRDRQ